jgi:peroxiredoxin Q/BCP
MFHLKEGDKAPDFSAADQNGKIVSLKDFKGKKVVLYFYPKDDTPGCTAEACDLRDNHAALNQAGYQVVGVSTDSTKSHLKFVEKYQLPFTLLADESKQICMDYGIWGEKKFMGKTYQGIHRTTFLISEKGIIEKIITKVETKKHTSQILS